MDLRRTYAEKRRKQLEKGGIFLVYSVLPTWPQNESPYYHDCRTRLVVPTKINTCGTKAPTENSELQRRTLGTRGNDPSTLSLGTTWRMEYGTN